MKKKIKHKFTHGDPENLETAGGKKTNKITESEIPAYVKKDLKNVLISTSLFGVLIIVIYTVQNKTNILDPVLRLFGI